MVLSPEEVTLLHGMVQTATNVTTYGYEVAIKGTMVNGIASLISLVLVLISTTIVGSRMINWARKEVSEGEDETIMYVFAFFAIFTVLLLFSLIAGVIQDSIISIFAPEYVVVKQILAVAT